MVSLPNLSSGTGISNDVINGTLLIKIFSLLFKKNCISTSETFLGLKKIKLIKKKTSAAPNVAPKKYPIPLIYLVFAIILIPFDLLFLSAITIKYFSVSS